MREREREMVILYSGIEKIISFALGNFILIRKISMIDFFLLTMIMRNSNETNRVQL